MLSLILRLHLFEFSQAMKRATVIVSKSILVLNFDLTHIYVFGPSHLVICVYWQVFLNRHYYRNLIFAVRQSIFIEIFLPKSKPVLTGILKIPDICEFVNCLERIFSNTNAIESQKCFLLGDININLQPKDK